jgi:hypothetical protein
MSLERARVVAVIRAVRDAVLEDRASGVVRQQHPWGCEIVRRACADHGVAVDQWVAALRAEPELARLFEQTMDELVAELPDPGPYDEIPREETIRPIRGRGRPWFEAILR